MKSNFLAKNCSIVPYGTVTCKSKHISGSTQRLKSFEQEQKGKLEFAMLLNSRSLGLRAPILPLTFRWLW